MAIQIRRGTDAEWEAGKQNIVVGEPCVTTDTGRFFIGTADGFSEMARMEDIGSFEEDIESLQGEITEINEALETKADKSDTYSKEDVDGLLEGKASTEALEELSDELDSKADSSSVYTKSETDTLLSGKASASDLDALEEEMADYKQMYLDSLIHTTASGSIASFSDGFDDAPMDYCTASIEPVQDLHGQSNPYPAGGGKNLLPMTAYEGVAYNPSEGAVFSMTPKETQPTDNGNGTFTINFTATWKYYCFVVPLANGQTYAYNIQYASTGQAGSTIGYLDAEMKVLTKVNATDASKTLTSTATGTDERKYLYLCISNRGTATATITITNPQVELGSTATAYAPYSNICPISGFTGCEVVRSGKNLIKTTLESQTKNGITYTVNDDGTIRVQGTATATSIGYIGNCIIREDATYYASGCPSGGSASTYRMYCSWGTNEIGNGTQRALTKGTSVYLQISIASGVTIDATFKPMLCKLSSGTDYEPYQANTYSVTWEDEAGTVYGGSVDLVSGVLTVEWKKAVLNGSTNVSANWRPQEGSSAWLYGGSAFDTIKSDYVGGVICESLPSVDYGTIYGTSIGVSTLSSASYSLAVRVPVEGLNTQALVNAYLQEHPITIVYKSTQPTTYQLTPQEITTLLGNNNVWADTGDTSVGYVANTKLYIDSKLS